MTEWREKLLGEVITLQRGFDLTQAQATAGAYPVISSGGGTYTTNVPKVQGPGVITGRKGVLGKVFFSRGPYWPHDTTLWVKDFKGAVPRFIYYLLQTLPLASLDAGASNPTLNRNHAHLLPVRIPCPAIQEVIANVLGSLDDLAESNRRRVELLEAMARSIYREWFVHFRYPGYETSTLVSSIGSSVPANWEVVTVGDVLTLHYGKALKKEDRRGGPVAVVGSSGVVGSHDEMLVSGPVVVVGRKGNVGSVIWIDDGAWPIDTTYFVSTDLPLRFVAEQLRRTEFLNTHAAVPGLSREQAYSRPFLKPPMHLMESFVGFTDTFANEARAISEQNERLSALRDLLLPRLVTGQIDVSALDAAEPLESAMS